MRKTTKNTKYFRSAVRKCLTLVLMLTMLLEAMAISISGVITELDGIFESSSSSQTNGGSTSFDSDAVSEALRGDIIKSLKADLIQRVEDNNMSEEEAEETLLKLERKVRDERRKDSF